MVWLLSKLLLLFWGFGQSAYHTQTALPTAVLRTPKHEQKSIPPERNRKTCLVTNDIAVMGGSKNDQTAHFVLLLVPPASCRYIRNVVYAETLIRTHTFGQSLKIRRLFYDFKADFVVLDTNGVGIGGYDNLVQEQDDEQIMTCSV